MEIVVSLKVQDYVYLFYQKSAQALQKSPEELMEQALFTYAGMIAQNMLQDGNDPNDP